MLITPTEIVENSCEIPSTVRRRSVAVSTVSRPPTSTAILKPSSYRVSVATSILERLNIRTASG
jgi:hypothetical protein